METPQLIEIIGFSTVAALGIIALVRRGLPRNGTQRIHNSRENVLGLIFDAIERMKDSPGNELWSKAGELEPHFYKKIVPLLVEVFEKDEKAKLRMICGPRIVVESDLYRQFADENGQAKPGAWRAHPILEFAHEFPGQVELYVRRSSAEPNDRHCFGSTAPDAPFFTESPHREWERPRVLVEQGVKVGYNRLRAEFDEQIESDDMDKLTDMDSIGRSFRLNLWDEADMRRQGERAEHGGTGERWAEAPQ